MTLRCAAWLDGLAVIVFTAIALAGRHYLRGNRA